MRNFILYWLDTYATFTPAPALAPRTADAHTPSQPGMDSNGFGIAITARMDSNGFGIVSPPGWIRMDSASYHRQDGFEWIRMDSASHLPAPALAPALARARAGSRRPFIVLVLKAVSPPGWIRMDSASYHRHQKSIRLVDTFLHSRDRYKNARVRARPLWMSPRNTGFEDFFNTRLWAAFK